MKTERILNATNWKYAISELALIVVGVSLALIANSLYSARQERIHETRILEQIEIALQADSDALEGQLQILARSEQQLSGLLNALRSGEVPEADMRYSLDAVTVWRSVTLRSGPYEELKNGGLSLISDDSLRQNLVDLYDSRFQNLRITTENDAIFSRDLALPYFYSRFRRLPEGSWEPVDGYSQLQDDVYFENLVAAKLARLEQFVLPNYRDFLELTGRVFGDVRDELGSP